MRIPASVLSRVAAGLSLGLCLASASLAQTSLETLADTVERVESRLGARVGVSLVDTGSGLSWTHRENERFLMNSTMKVPLCGAVLARRDAGDLSLQTELPVRKSDLLAYAPVTEKRAGGEMTIAELCLAAIDMSDNTAANLLIAHLGSPQAVTRFFRSAGDTISRLDRNEPELNTFNAADLRDTTTPAAMTETLRGLLLGDVLSRSSRGQLAEWMSHGGVTGNLLRAEAPEGWVILDKSGSGTHTRNLVALVTPVDGSPWIVTIFVSDVDADSQTRNRALQDVGRAAMAVMRD
ncbi:class A beta-lactamase [Rhodovulum sulfidophilum]|uniref:class A beta-lactamase n=1 Tax=Rhodovulum sulfidophilum TaxID=35806 RepID=UPI001EFF1C73|nr:class A beta-lactamase [Rhodovulum sulfidophilum]MCE8438834.1 class A beta-lactamase [Rhodovulum sulfidophilum]MCE8468145.1 class A beta-lactamase [Rhodovulum sulfidophilum]